MLGSELPVHEAVGAAPKPPANTRLGVPKSVVDALDF
jgi:hypothetical protein